MNSTVLLVAGVVASGCVSTTPGARPDDMSAAEHRAAAAAEEEVAEEHEDQYDPDAVAISPAAGLDWNEATVEYNPTMRHRDRAQTHRRRAADHRVAAEVLENFEEGECRAFRPPVRAACPLLGQLESVEEVDSGVRLRFRDGVNLDAVAAHVRCHIAYGRTRDYDGMVDCPIYLRDLRVLWHPESRVLVLTADDEVAVAELRRRAATHVGATGH